MSATPNFLAAFRSTERSLVVLAAIELRDPVSLAPSVIYLSSSSITTPDGQAWSHGLGDVSSVIAPGSFVETDIPLCTMSLSLLRRRLYVQPEGEDLSNALSAYLWDNARVTAYLWETSLTDFGDALQVFAGNVLSWSLDARELALHLRQRADWNRMVTPKVVTIEEFPHAPEDSVGQSVPIYYGRVPDVEWRPPYPVVPLFKREGSPVLPDLNASTVIGGRRAGPAILVDTGRGAGAVTNPKAKVLVASHKLHKVGDRSVGLNFYQKLTDGVAVIDSLDPADVFNADDGAGFYIADNAVVGWAHALPSDVNVVTNNCENPRAILDTFNDQNYARFDWTAGERVLRAKFPALDASIGDASSIHAFAVWESVSSWTDVRLRVRNTSTGFATDVFFNSVVPAAPNPTNGLFCSYVFLGAPWGGVIPVQPWAFSECELEFGWPTSTGGGVSPVTSGAGKLHLFALGFLIRFTPRQRTVESEKIIERMELVPVKRRRLGPRGASDGTIWEPHSVQETRPAVTELVGKFFANVEGHEDTAGAEFASGAAFGLVERPCDVAAHVLATYGGEPLASIEQGFGVHGSFRDARADLKVGMHSIFSPDMRHAFFVGEATDVSTVLAWVAAGSASFFYLDRFTDKWKTVVWRNSRAASYPFKFAKRDLSDVFGVRTETTPTSQLMTGVRMNYGYDAISRSFLHSLRVAADGSSAPHFWRGIRDEQLSVIAGSNDRLDFSSLAVNYTANLTVGDYDDPDVLAAMVSAAMKTAVPAEDFCVVYGPTIIAGYNDRIEWHDDFGNADRVATLTAARYDSWVDVCVEIAVRMTEQVPTGGDGSLAYNSDFDLATGKVSIWRESLLYQTRLKTAGGTVRCRRCLMTLGIDTLPKATPTGDLPAAYTFTAIRQRTDETFVVGALGDPILGPGSFLELRFENGPNGLKGTKRSCASLLGYFALRDKSAGADSYLGDTPKGTREQFLARAAERYGARRDIQQDLRAVYDSATARELRNRLVALLGRTRVVVEFATDRAPDVERGMVVEFDSDIDTVVAYPEPGSDGSWVGKTFVVTETEQLLGPTAFFTRIRAVSLD